MASPTLHFSLFCLPLHQYEPFTLSCYPFYSSHHYALLYFPAFLTTMHICFSCLLLSTMHICFSCFLLTTMHFCILCTVYPHHYKLVPRKRLTFIVCCFFLPWKRDKLICVVLGVSVPQFIHFLSFLSPFLSLVEVPSLSSLFFWHWLVSWCDYKGGSHQPGKPRWCTMSLGA